MIQPLQYLVSAIGQCQILLRKAYALQKQSNCISAPNLIGTETLGKGQRRLFITCVFLREKLSEPAV